jgi:hypothetical protein
MNGTVSANADERLSAILTEFLAMTVPAGEAPRNYAAYDLRLRLEKMRESGNLPETCSVLLSYILRPSDWYN